MFEDFVVFVRAFVGHIQNLQIRFNLIVTDVLSYCDADAKSNLLVEIFPTKVN